MHPIQKRKYGPNCSIIKNKNTCKYNLKKNIGPSRVKDLHEVVSSLISNICGR